MWENLSKVQELMMDYIQLPREILEVIFLHCDGKTLLAVQQVSHEWNAIIESLDKKYNVWKQFCSRDIPMPELSYYATQSVSNWLSIYKNRVLWHNIEGNIEFSLKPFYCGCEYISCIAVDENRIACALDTHILIFDQRSAALIWKTTLDASVDKVVSLHFIPGLENALFINCDHMLLSGFVRESQHLYLDGDGILTSHPVLHDRVCDVYRDFYCGFSSFSVCSDYSPDLVFGQITNSCFGLKSQIIAVVPMVRVYTNFSLAVTHVRMIAENRCLVMIHQSMYLVEKNDCDQAQYEPDSGYLVRQLDYRPFVDQGMLMSNLVKVWLMNEDVLVTSVAHSEKHPQVVEFYLHKAHADTSTKFIRPQKVFGTKITSFHLHGNTLAIGTLKGLLYLYEINDCADWDTLDIAQYSHVIDLGIRFGPVKCIRAVDQEGQRVFWVSSDWDQISIVTGQAKIPVDIR